MLVSEQENSVTVEYGQFMFGGPAGQLELLEPQHGNDLAVSVGRRGILFFELYNDYASTVRIEVHDKDPGQGDYRALQHVETGTIDVDESPVFLSSLMGEPASEHELELGKWNFVVYVTGREDARRVVDELASGDSNYDYIVERIAEVEKWVICMWPA